MARGGPGKDRVHGRCRGLDNLRAGVVGGERMDSAEQRSRSFREREGTGKPWGVQVTREVGAEGTEVGLGVLALGVSWTVCSLGCCGRLGVEAPRGHGKKARNKMPRLGGVGKGCEALTAQNFLVLGYPLCPCTHCCVSLPFSLS